MSTDTSDCEQRDDWLLEQDVNAWSSLAYVAAGLLLAWVVRRARLPTAVYGLAAIAIAEGFGSLLYHGTASDVGQFLHDVPLIGALGFVAGWHVGRLRDRTDAGSLVGLAAGLVVSAAVWALAPGATNIAVAVTVAVIVVASLIARRRRMAAVWSWPLLALGAAAITVWALGTPDSPACNADSWLQPHGLWHALTAVVALAWVDRAYATDDPNRAPRLFRRFTDRTLGLVARGLVLAFHRSVDVRWRGRLPRDQPVLIVANHGNGFVDPVVVAGVLGRLPRFL
ncbi:MAG TPA: ceramidase domain-containing protein, partial [Ilumatobacteraceae bacterium]|nr:ceramidase domain-containing protein [Ilumatobacteraceae bacterium]